MEGKVRIGLLFGSFNPVHVGHLFMAEMAIESGHVDAIWFVVSPESPYKTGTGTLALASHRYAMVVRACGYSGKFSVEDIEFRMEPPSYTYLTLAKLKERNPDYEFYFICGTDVYVDIPNWHGGKEVIDACKFLVYPRTTSKNYTPEDMADKTIFRCIGDSFERTIKKWKNYETFIARIRKTIYRKS